MWSVRQMNFLVSWIAVVLMTVVVPLGVTLMWWGGRREPSVTQIALISSAVQLVLAVPCAALLQRNLRLRRFMAGT